MAIITRWQYRADTAANWTASNPTLAAGEIGVEKDTQGIKVGDGVTAWAALAYLFPVGGTLAAIGALLAPLSTSAPQALDAAGGAAPTHAFAIPAGARSFAVGSCNAARTNYLTGFAAPSDLAHTHSAGVVTLNGSGFIPALLDDGATAPTHIYVENTDASAGWAWVEFYG